MAVKVDDESTRKEQRRLTTRCWSSFTSMYGYIFMNIVIQISFGIYFSCFYAILGPLSKQFHFTDSKLGFINTADDIGRIPFLLITAYFGSRWHIPKVLGLAGCAYSIIAISITIPYFIFKHGKGIGDLSTLSTNGSNISTIFPLCNVTSNTQADEKAIIEMQFSDNVAYYVAIAAYVLMGAASSPWASLYMYYIDENADKKKFPLMMGILYSTGMVGPVIGTYLAAAVNRIFVDLTATDLTPEDPTFIGAWWLGLLISASVCLISCPFLCCYPRTMKTDAQIKEFLDEASRKELTRRLSRRFSVPNPRRHLSIYSVTESRLSLVRSDSDTSDNEVVQLDDRRRSVVKMKVVAENAQERRKRYMNLMNDIYRLKNAPRLLMDLLRNPVYMLLILVQVAWRYEYGNVVFIVKFFTMQFDLADWEAAAVLGTQSTISGFCSAFGVFLGGFAVYRFRPTFSQATLYCVVLYSSLMFFAIGEMYLGCENFVLYGLDDDTPK